MRLYWGAILAAGLALAGCADINWDAGKLFPPSQPAMVDLAVSSEPAGAQAKLSTGQGCAATPCVIKAPYGAEKYVVTFSLKGYLDQAAEAHWVVAGEGGDGMEASRELTPNPVFVELEAAPPPPPAKRKPAPKAKPKPKPAAQ